MLHERRRLRSESPLEAIRNQLQVVAHRLGARALVVADGRGSLLGAAPSEYDSRNLADLSPLLLDSARDPGLQMSLTGRLRPLAGRSLHVRPFSSQGRRYALTAVTDEPLGESQRYDLDRALTGVRRILNARPTLVCLP